MVFVPYRIHRVKFSRVRSKLDSSKEEEAAKQVGSRQRGIGDMQETSSSEHVHTIASFITHFFAIQ